MSRDVNAFYITNERSGSRVIGEQYDDAKDSPNIVNVQEIAYIKNNGSVNRLKFVISDNMSNIFLKTFELLSLLAASDIWFSSEIVHWKVVHFLLH